jgi:hypothetical protein
MTETEQLRRRFHEVVDQLEALGDEYEPDVSDWGPLMRRAGDLLAQIIETRAADDPAFQAELIKQTASIAEGLERRLHDAELRWAAASPQT